MAIAVGEGVRIQEISEEEARELFDEIVRRELGIPAEEFLAKWDVGEYTDVEEIPELVRVVMALPFVR